MKVVFLAGPYRASTEQGVYQNIHRASDLALKIWQLGAACVCPQKNTAFFGGAADDHVWLDGDKEILRRCDAVFVAPNWKESPGAIGEHRLAADLGMPIFEELDALSRWIQESNT